MLWILHLRPLLHSNSPHYDNHDDMKIQVPACLLATGNLPPTFWPPDSKKWLIGKDPDAGKDWGQEQKGAAEDEMLRWRHQLNGHEFEQTSGDSEGQGGLACYSPWGHKESDTTEWLNWTEHHYPSIFLFLIVNWCNSTNFLMAHSGFEQFSSFTTFSFEILLFLYFCSICTSALQCSCCFVLVWFCLETPDGPSSQQRSADKDVDQTDASVWEGRLWRQTLTLQVVGSSVVVFMLRWLAFSGTRWHSLQRTSCMCSWVCLPCQTGSSLGTGRELGFSRHLSALPH